MLGHWLETTPILDFYRRSVQADNGSGAPAGPVDQLSFFHLTSDAVTAALDRPLAMTFPQETPLEDVVAYIKSSTRGEHLPDGIPIYVDPVGLTEAEKTMSSPINLELRGVPLRRSLSLLLQQVDLTYTVDDGLVTITSPTRVTVTDRVEAFRRVGHGLFAWVFALLGGFAARVLWSTKRSGDREMPRARSSVPHVPGGSRLRDTSTHGRQRQGRRDFSVAFASRSGMGDPTG